MSKNNDKGAGTFQADASEHDQGHDQGHDQAADTGEKVPAPYTGVTPGQLLRDVREARGQSVAEVAAALRLRISVIEALEADDYEPLRGSTFVRGYFRSLARLYDIDAKPLAEAYEAMGFGAPAASTLKMQSFSRRKIREKSDGRLMFISYVIIAAVIGAAAWWWWQQQSAPDTEVTMPERSSIEAQPRDQLTEAQVAEQQREAERLEAERAAAEQAAQQQADQQQADLGTAGAEPLTQVPAPLEPQLEAERLEAERAAAELAAQQQDTDDAKKVPAPLSGDQLTLVFSQQCWVKVTDATGTDVAIGVKEAGYEMPLTGKAPFDIILCKPEAVVMTFNDSEVDLSQYRRNRSVTLRLE